MAKRLIRGRRWVWLGALLFVALVIVRAPAALIGLLLPAGAVALETPAGTLWRGSAVLALQHAPIGVLEWRWLPAALADGELGVALALEGDGISAKGRVFMGIGQSRLDGLQADLDEQAVQRLLHAYDIGANGRLHLEDLAAERTRNGYRSATGSVRWAGGSLAYRLQGRRYEAELPPMHASLVAEGQTLRLAAVPLRPVGGAGTAPLLRLALRPDGWFVAGASRAFIELAGQQWQGQSAPSDVVLEVEEKLF